MQVPLSHQVDVAGFHTEATRFLARQVPPHDLQWSVVPEQAVEEEDLAAGRALIRNRAARAIIPQSFIRMSELVVLHRDPQRFDLLYRSLWRLVYEPELKKDMSDCDLARLRQMAQAVRRDIQKMKKRLVFRPLPFRGEPLPVAWYEPAHYVCEAVGSGLARDKPESHWILMTPDRTMWWDGQRLLSAPPVASPAPADPADPADDARWTAILEAMPWL